MTNRPMINEALRLIRLYWGYSQVELASKLGITQSLISEIEGGKKDVSIDTLEKYSDHLGIKMSQIMFFAEEVAENPSQKRGRLIIADHVLRLLDKMSPREPENA